MYRRRSEIALKASSSLLSNNISANRDSASEVISYAYVHKYAVHLVVKGPNHTNTHHHVSCKIPTANQQASPVAVLQVDWVTVSAKRILVVATQKGVQMYEADGSALLHWHAFGSPNEAVMFTRGICGIGNHICVGTSSGQILVFQVPMRGINITFEEYLQGSYEVQINDLVRRPRGTMPSLIGELLGCVGSGKRMKLPKSHTSSIGALACSCDLMASSDEEGSIGVWQYQSGSFRQLTKVQGYGSPCSCVALWQNLLIAGYGSGHLRVFSTDDVKAGQRCPLRIEVTAHARWINGLSLAPQNGLCLTVSEDTFARVWQLHCGPDPKISLAFATTIADTQIVGGCFTRDDGSGFATAGYDRAEIQVFEC